MNLPVSRERPQAGAPGDHAAVVRGFAWSGTAIGASATWPERMTAIVDAMLVSPVPMLSAWGRDGVVLFNGALAALLVPDGPLHLGGAVCDACPAVLDLVAAAAEGRSLSVAERALTDSGPWLDLDASPIPGRDGAVLGALIVAADASARVEAARRGARAGLARVPARFEARWTADPRGGVVALSARWVALVGMAERDAVGTGWLKAVHPEDRARTSAAWTAAIEGLRPYEIEHRLRTGDGPYRWMRSRATALRTANGTVTSWQGATEPLDQRQVVENRQSLLLDLADRFRNASDRREVAATAAAALGREIGAAQVIYADIDPIHHGAVVEADWIADAPGSAEPGRRAPLDGLAFGRVSDLEAGMTIIGSAGDRVGLVVPLVRDGRLRALFHVAAEGPRTWSPEEVALTEDVATRTADALERIQAAAILRRNQARQSFLLVLGDRLRESTSTAEIMEDTVEAVGRQLHAARAGYGEVVAEGDAIAFATGWSDGTVAPLRGEIDIAELGTHADELRRGLTTVFEGEAEHAGYARAIVRGLRTAVGVPLIRDGRLRALLTLGRRDAHRWTAEEIALIGEVAARMWEALERARAEAALRDLNATLESRVEQRTAELRSSEARFRTLFENAPAAIVLIRVGPAGDATYEAVNAEAERFMGLTPGEIVGRRVSDDADDPLAARCRECAETGRPVQYEASVEVAGDLRTAEGVLAPLSMGDGADTLLIGISRDITAQRRAEAQLLQAQKMEAIGQLTGGIAHDFNNLLTGIIGSLALMQKRVAQGRTDTLERYAGLAMASANRAAALTHRLLAFSRRQPLEAKPVDVNRLVATMDDLLRRTLGESIVFESVESSGLWLTLCDPHQLENALLNLAINARDAMPDGGRLLIGTENVVLDEARAAGAPGDYVALSVSDTGVGMPPDVIARAFDPFFTTKPIGQGTGLGLSMIYGFVKQSGGHIKIESEPGHGTTIRIFLPRHGGSDEDAAAEAGDTAPRARDGETVLLVEDDATVRRLVRDVLQDLGYTALEAVDGPTGLATLESGHRIDLLVTDVGLPGMNGRQVAEQARLSRPDLKVLFITGYAENAAFGSGHLDPGMQMMTKPFAVDALAKRIRAMMEGH